MATPVVTVAAGGIPVIDVSLVASMTKKLGTPVSEAAPGKGTPVTKVTAFGIPVIYTTPTP